MKPIPLSKIFTLTVMLFAGISFVNSMEAEITDEVPVLPRSLFAQINHGEISPETQALLDRIQGNMGHTPSKILGTNEQGVVVYKINEAGGRRLYFYDTNRECGCSLTTGVLEEAHPYVHLGIITSDAIYWSYFPKDNPQTKIFYEFSLKDWVNNYFETPEPLFDLYFDRNRTIYGIADDQNDGRAIYLKRSKEEWEKVKEETDPGKSRFLNLARGPIIKKDTFNPKTSEQQYIVVQSLDDENKYELRFIRMQGDYISEPFCMGEEPFGIPVIVQLKLQNEETKEYNDRGIVFVPSYSQGRATWSYYGDEYAVLLFNSISNCIAESLQTSDFYFVPSDQGFTVIQDNFPSVPLIFKITDDTLPDNVSYSLCSIGADAQSADARDDENTLFAHQHQLAKSQYETIEMTNGMPLDCLVTKPLFGRENYPALIMPHGGPHRVLDKTFGLYAQFLANRGYVVIEPVFSGSDNSYEIYERGRGQYGELIQREMKEAARYYADGGLIDPERVGIIGVSFGGYVVNYQFTHPEKFCDIFPQGFKCFVSHVGASDLCKQIQEFKERMLTNNLLGIPGQIKYIEPLIEDIEVPLSDEAVISLQKNSPLFSAENGKGSFLLLHNSNDQKVPVEHSDRFSQALRGAGIPHTYGIFAGEGHNLKKNENWNVNFGLIENFLRQHLGGDRHQPLTQDEIDDSDFSFVVGEELLQ